LHPVGILFPHINDDARSKPHQIYPVNTSHHSDLYKKVSLQCYLVTTVIHIQSVRCQICVYIQIFFTI